MPRRLITEEDVQKIVAKYVHSVTRDPATIPDIHKLIKEALKGAAPDREIDDEDHISVIKSLQKKTVINDRTILEAAKEVVDHSAMEDLKFMVNRHIRALGRKPIDSEVERIIKVGKLNPHNSSLAQIKAAVTNYYATGKPLEHHSATEIRAAVRAELAKHGPVDDRDTTAVTSKYLDKADHDKPLNPDEIQDVVKTHLDIKTGIHPEPPQPDPTKPPNPVDGPHPTETTRTKGKKDTKHDLNRGDKPDTSGVKQGDSIPPKDPKNPTFFEGVRIKMRRYGIKSLTRGARNWLTDSVYNMTKPPNRTRLMSEGKSIKQALIGKMFLFYYDAKLKKTLPYWDKFPLIFIIELYKDGWLGLNLHYLPLLLRAKLFDKLLHFANDTSLDSITKLRLSYALLKSVSQFPEVRPCIKRYLSKYARSQLMTIEPINWEIALFVPVEQFQKQSKERVWADSKKKISKLRGRK